MVLWKFFILMIFFLKLRPELQLWRHLKSFESQSARHSISGSVLDTLDISEAKDPEKMILANFIVLFYCGTRLENVLAYESPYELFTSKFLRNSLFTTFLQSFYTLFLSETRKNGPKIHIKFSIFRPRMQKINSSR